MEKIGRNLARATIYYWFTNIAILVAVFAWVLSSVPTVPNWDTEPSCLGSFQDYAYSWRSGEDGLDQIIDSTWTRATPAPFLTGSRGGTDVTAIQQRNASTHVLVIRWIPVEDSLSRSYDILDYDIENHDWSSLSADIDGEKFYVDKLFVSPDDGALYGTVDWNGRLRDGRDSEVTVLARQNAEEKSWEFLPSLGEIRVSSHEGFGGGHRSFVMQDQSGTFWIFPHNGTVYRYDPQSEEVQMVAEIPDHSVWGATVNPDASAVYLRVALDPYSFKMESGQLIKVDTLTGVVENLPVPAQIWPGTSTILFDHSNRLWYGAIGWLDDKSAWSLLHPDPLGYLFSRQTSQQHTLMHTEFPRPYLETSDGRIWFTSLRGGAWLDTESGQGCWFTTEPEAVVVEDQTNTVWVSIDSDLYTWSLNSGQ